MSALAATRNVAPEMDEQRDWRIRDLVGPAQWQRLPVPVQRRFSKPLELGTGRLYTDRVIETELTKAGWLLAQAGRLVGAPLPLEDGSAGASAVCVMRDDTIGGQVWTRVYPRRGKFPQVVHSAKRFRGPTGLEEYIGCGIGMELAVSVESGRLVFRSQRYLLLWGRWRIPIVSGLTPGAMEIVHEQCAGGEFRFGLVLRHPWFGLLVRQEARYRDA